MFAGFYLLAEYAKGLFQTRNSSGVPTTADAAPSFRVYGDSATPLATGTSSGFDAGNVTGFYQWSVLLDAGAGFTRGRLYTVRGQWQVSSVVYTESQVFFIQ